MHMAKIRTWNQCLTISILTIFAKNFEEASQLSTVKITAWIPNTRAYIRNRNLQITNICLSLAKSTFFLSEYSVLIREPSFRARIKQHFHCFSRSSNYTKRMVELENLKNCSNLSEKSLFGYSVF